MTNYKITRTVPRNPASEYVHDPLFSVDRKHAALDIHTGFISGLPVDDGDDQLDDALRAGVADLLGGQYPYARAGFIRGALRPASRGAGRGRWR
jgi:hypothetical protein